MKGIQLRRLTSEDAPQLARLANNKKIWDHVRDYLPHPYAESDAHFFIELIVDEDPHQTFGILNEDDELCGVIGLVIQSDVYRISAELGYWLGEPYWGQGIVTQAIGLITQYGFEELRLEKIYAGVFDFNTASMKVLEKNGYQKEGILSKAFIKNGRIGDEHRYAKLKTL
ncbi:MAG: GNAT family protein [Bacteroidota bacterium]